MAHAAGREAPILTVSVAAELAGMHPQTVRQYDRLGLVPAKRTRGGGRRYSLSDVDKRPFSCQIKDLDGAEACVKWIVPAVACWGQTSFRSQACG